ncbi:unnamed protein product [Vicia faba]|uniref:Reverse transcriptase zinc-binding domain-containing protein n=1 Tax=Vicia faba TaxID=3906 RepID=A0AAV0YN80_VICFA|nr:unnamed protein product [Vicia faba]
MDTLRENFVVIDANHICSIPLSLNLPEDKLIWHHETDNNYSVKTAYYWLGEQRRNFNLGPSSKGKPKIWNHLWKLKVNPRVKNFMWRLFKDILPTKTNLLRKGTLNDGLCPLCNSELENNLHLFLRCDFIRKVFFSIPLEIRIPTSVVLRTGFAVFSPGKTLNWGKLYQLVSGKSGS